MEEIKSLADQLRNHIKPPGGQTKPASGADPKFSEPTFSQDPQTVPKDHTILELLRAFDNTDHKSMVHVRFDAKTLRTMNQFKMATGVDVTKLVAYAVRQLFTQHPELKLIIKQFLQNIDL